MQVIRICSRGNFSPARCLRKDSPWREGLEENKNRNISIAKYPVMKSSPKIFPDLSQTIFNSRCAELADTGRRRRRRRAYSARRRNAETPKSHASANKSSIFLQIFIAPHILTSRNSRTISQWIRRQNVRLLWGWGSYYIYSTKKRFYARVKPLLKGEQRGGGVGEWCGDVSSKNIE